MIVNVATLPDSARQPLLLALRLQALSITFEKAEDKGPILQLSGELGTELLSIIDRAKAEGFASTDAVGIADEKASDLRDAAALLWSIGMLRLRKAIGDGSWVPSEIDLGISLKDDLLLNSKPKYQGKGFTSINPEKGRSALDGFR